MARKKIVKTKAKEKRPKGGLKFAGIEKNKLTLNNPIIPKSRLIIKLKGRSDSPLIVQAWSDKAYKEMLAKMLPKDSQEAQEIEQTPKDPKMEALNSVYWLNGKPDKWEDVMKYDHGIPWIHVKKASADAAWNYKNHFPIKSKKAVLGGIDFLSDNHKKQLVKLIPLEPPTIDERWVRQARGGTTLRYRPLYSAWECILNVLFDIRFLSPQQIYNWICLGGELGLAEMRGESGFQMGRYDTELIGSEIQKFAGEKKA